MNAESSPIFPISVLDIQSIHVILNHWSNENAIGPTMRPYWPPDESIHRLEEALQRSISIWQAIACEDHTLVFAAVVAHTLTRMHPFGNGNKRLAYLALKLLLSRLNFTLRDDPKFVSALIDSADHQITDSLYRLIELVRLNAYISK